MILDEKKFRRSLNAAVILLTLAFITFLAFIAIFTMSCINDEFDECLLVSICCLTWLFWGAAMFFVNRCSEHSDRTQNRRR